LGGKGWEVGGEGAGWCGYWLALLFPVPASHCNACLHASFRVLAYSFVPCTRQNPAMLACTLLSGYWRDFVVLVPEFPHQLVYIMLKLYTGRKNKSQHQRF